MKHQALFPHPVEKNLDHTNSFPSNSQKEVQAPSYPSPFRQSSSPQTSQNVQAVQEEKTQTNQNEKKLRTLAKQSQTVLFKCSAVFPFDFFPDELSIEPTQVNLCKKIFFWTAQTTSVPIRNISDVVVKTGPFFASMEVLDQYFKENSVEIMWLKKDDAEKARKIIQGLVIALKEKVDISQIKPETLASHVEELGHMQAIDQSSH